MKHALLGGLLLLLGSLLSTRLAQAQAEPLQWIFGYHAGLQFDSLRRPVPLAATPALVSAEASSALADSAGQLLAYTDGSQLWDRTHQPVPNSQLGSGAAVRSATQGTLLLRQPGSHSPFFYAFSIAAREDGLSNELRYCLFDQRLRNGLGGLVPGSPRTVPLGQRLTEKLVAVRHRNRRDYWLVLHGWQSNEFLCLLLSPAGLSANVVRSACGQRQQGPAQVVDSLANASGQLQASPDGRWLMMASGQLAPELFAFDNATGLVMQPRPLALPPGRYYGAAFSPDSRLLYLSRLTPEVYQVAMAGGAPPTVLRASGNVCALQLAPDGRLMLAEENHDALSVINSPNVPGPGSDLQLAAVALGGVARSRYAYLGLPNFPVEVDARYLELNGPAQACAGEWLQFEARLVLDSVAAARMVWEVDGTVVPGAGLLAIRLAPGLHVVRALAVAADGRRFAAVLRVQVPAAPTLDLGAPVQALCNGNALLLAPALTEPGATYQWSDGPGTASRLVQQPGRYRLTLRTATGCLATDSVTVVAAPTWPALSLGADTTVCAQAFPLRLRVPVLPPDLRWYWPDGSSAPEWAMPAPGLVSLRLENALGCSRTLSRQVQATSCPLPNIITPNGDALNQRFVLQGLHAPDWQLRIYNRWGREVYTQASYDNSWAAEGQPAGLYYYLLTNTRNGQRQRGWLEVAR